MQALWRPHRLTATAFCSKPTRISPLLLSSSLTSVTSCAASETVVNSHMPASPLARKGPFRIIATTPFRIALTRPSAGANPFVPPPRRQTSSDHDRRPGSELTSVRGQILALPDSPSTPCDPFNAKARIATSSLCRRYQARRHRRRADLERLSGWN